MFAALIFFMAIGYPAAIFALSRSPFLRLSHHRTGGDLAGLHGQLNHQLFSGPFMGDLKRFCCKLFGYRLSGKAIR
jgi:hypothetical protein